MDNLCAVQIGLLGSISVSASNRICGTGEDRHTPRAPHLSEDQAEITNTKYEAISS